MIEADRVFRPFHAENKFIAGQVDFYRNLFFHYCQCFITVRLERQIHTVTDTVSPSPVYGKADVIGQVFGAHQSYG